MGATTEANRGAPELLLAVVHKCVNQVVDNARLVFERILHCLVKVLGRLHKTTNDLQCTSTSPVLEACSCYKSYSGGNPAQLLE